MKYSTKFRENIIQKVLNGQKVKDVAEEAGITGWSIYQWIKQHKNGNIQQERIGPRGFDLKKKQSLLLESKTITKNKMGIWLRKNGVHSEHLIKWEKEIEEIMNKNSKDKIENKRLLKENARLKKELERKDKALAEAAILLTLKKKYQHLWEDEDK